jgi:hypothetical protein
MLRRIHAVSPGTAGITGHHDGAAVLVHGDYGPNNTLLDPAAPSGTPLVHFFVGGASFGAM